ncbi:MAG: DUF72 domain-containing protein [Nitrospiraceae bacterium]|nr:MAG: DUF72 domain-containing protein [Nitrospiraceae bacterium]
MPKYRIGCSGFLYESWKGAFYPEDLPHKKWLSFYQEKFNSVELNVTFYRLLKKEAFERWYKETPPDFTFCLKGSRFISHVKKLKDVELPLSTFFNVTAPLMEKLDVILWQLPPNLRLNIKNLEDFVEILKTYPVRHVFEFRHKSWLSKRVCKLLSSANIAICMADWPEFINEVPITADFVYIRRHGEGGNYSTNYTPEQLKHDAKQIKEYLKQGKDVYYYFNNDAFAYAPKNAIELRTILESSLPKALKEKLEKPEKPKAPKKKAAKKKAKKTAKKTAKKAVKKTKKEVVKKAAKKITKKTAKKVVKKTVKKAVKKTAGKKVKKVTQKITKKPSSKAKKKTVKKRAKANK